MTFENGDRFGRYTILSTLGHGGMGAVYLAHDAVLKREVALKILRVEDDDAHAERLLKEARAAAAIAHPNAVAIFDVGEEDGVAYMTMELIKGKTLRAYVGDASVSSRRRIAWLADVARALAAAHLQGVVHRDIKPENVMVRDDGVVKVLDFGIARRTIKPVDAGADTQAEGAAPAHSTLAAGATHGALVGTPAYMAPEQLRGERIEGATDQFAWGVLAYELLTGAMPWDTKVSMVQLVAQITSRDPDPPGLGDALDAVVLRALAKDRRARFASMEEALAALEAASVASPVATHPAATERSEPLPRRRAWLAIALAVLAGVAGMVGIVHPWSRAPAISPSAAAASASAPIVGPPDFGSQMSTNADALAAYDAGMQAYRDAARAQARVQFERATQLDPSFAAAHLRRALSFAIPDDATREHLQKARQLRSALGDHDLALLDAIEPWLRVPPDPQELTQRLDALERSARDGDSLLLVCFLRGELDDHTRAIAACAAAARLDPRAAAPHRGEATGRFALDDVAGGMAALQACLDLAPASTSCLSDLQEVSAFEGRCDDALVQARRLTAAAPQSPTWRLTLAVALLGAGEPLDTCREALRQSFDVLDPPQRAMAEPAALARLAVLTGDFEDALRRVDAWKRAVSSSAEEAAHQLLLDVEAELMLEIGRPAAAAAAARSYVRNRSAWTPMPYLDNRISPLVLRYRAGDLSRADLAREREAWLALPRDAPPGIPWILGYAYATLDEQDARTALEALPRFVPLPPARFRTARDDEPIGATYLRAGRVEEAIPFLERAARSCKVLDYPFQQTRASLELAVARERSGDVVGACAAAGTVLARWGAARPASITAAQARQLVTRLRCPSR